MRVINGSGATFYRFDSDDDGVERVTFVLKASFALVHGGAMLLLPQDRQREIEGERPHMDMLGRSPAWPSDLVDLKPRTDIIVLGSTYAPGGVPTAGWGAGFRCGPIERHIVAWGERYWLKSGVPTVPVPTKSVPLRWELAYGGLMDPRNLFGRGSEPDATGLVPLPCLEDPQQLVSSPRDRPSPVNLGPVPAFFAERQAKLGTRDNRWALFRAPLPPDDFDPSYRNAAPASQQTTTYLVGDEQVILANLHPRIPQLVTNLPCVRPRVGLLGAVGDGIELPMHLDTVLLLPDEDEAVLLWRATVMFRPGEENAPKWAVAVFEPLGAEPRPLGEVLAPAIEAREAARPPDAEAEQAESELAAAQALAQSFADARQLLAGLSLPPAVMMALDGTDGQKALDALLGYAQAELTRLGATGL